MFVKAFFLISIRIFLWLDNAATIIFDPCKDKRTICNDVPKIKPIDKA